MAQHGLLHGGDLFLGGAFAVDQQGTDPGVDGQAALHVLGRGNGDNRHRRTVFGEDGRDTAGLSEGQDGRGLQLFGGAACGAAYSLGLRPVAARLRRNMPVHPQSWILFHVKGYMGHHGNGLNRMRTNRSFTREHHRVAAVEHRIGDVRSLGPGGPGV